MKLLSIMGAAAAIALTAPSVYAEDGSAKKASFGDVTVAELQTAIKEGKVTVVDVNRANVYNAGHVPGALHFPTVKEKGLKAALPGDKTALIVAYCSGPQ